MSIHSRPVIKIIRSLRPVRVFVPEDQACSVMPRPTEYDDLGRPAVEVVQQERPSAMHRNRLAPQRGVSAEKDSGVVRVLGAPYFHHDHVAALRHANTFKTCFLIGLLGQARAVCLLPPPVLEVKDQASIHISATYMEQLDPFIGHLPITHIDDDSLAPYIHSKLHPAEGKPVTNRTVNIALQRVIRVLNLCARKWRDEERRPWLDVVPMTSLLDEKTKARKPYPLSWDEQSILFAELPAHLADDGHVQGGHWS